MRIAIRRYDPPPNERRSLAFFDVDLEPTSTVLDALLWIAEQADPTLAFRRMCRSGICGACAGIVNGSPRLFCQTLLRDAKGTSVPGGVAADILLEPLPQFRVLKDLVVDMDPFVDELMRCETWLEPATGYDGRVRPDVMEALWPVACCVLCGICVEQDIDRPHPAAAARVLRLAADPRDARGRARLDLLGDLDLQQRVTERLRAVCPAGVDIQPVLAHIRGTGDPTSTHAATKHAPNSAKRQR